MLSPPEILGEKMPVGGDCFWVSLCFFAVQLILQDGYAPRGFSFGFCCVDACFSNAGWVIL